MSRPARALLFLVRVYQSFFSALMPSACKFYPSCSHYAAEALRVHGARRGSWLALKRVLRCHPFTRGGVDLVPDAEDLDGCRTLAVFARVRVFWALVVRARSIGRKPAPFETRKGCGTHEFLENAGAHTSVCRLGLSPHSPGKTQTIPPTKVCATGARS